MKKIIFLILSAVLLYPHSSSAQFVTGFGLKGGVTLSNQNFVHISNVDFEHKLQLGFNGSAFAEFLNNRYINIVAEAGYDQRGYRIALIRTDEFGNYLGEYFEHNRTHYLFTALGAKLKYKGNDVTPYFLLLPRVDFYLGYNSGYSEEIYPGAQDIENPVLKDFKEVLFGVGVGAGIEFNRLLPFKVFAEANYNPGIINSYGSSYAKVKEYSFNFKVGINFIKDKKVEFKGKM